MTRWCVAMVIVLINGCGVSKDPPATISESWDQPNSPALFGAGPLLYERLASDEGREGSLAFKPWRDNYWPYVEKSIARRYLADREFGSAAEQLADAASAPGNPLLSPAEKYDVLLGDETYALASESWDVYERLREKYGTDFASWNWMGLCSGWAPASVSEPEPRAHVAATYGDGTEVLFFNGDIRGLLSKAYDMNATDRGHQTIGLRCDEPAATFARDETWRLLDGQFAGEHRRFSIVSDYARESGVLEVQISGRGEQLLWLVASDPLRRLSGPVEVWLYSDRAGVIADLAADTRGERAVTPDKVQVIFFRGCRDVNPASLHTVLVDNLSAAAKEQVPFVIEMTRAREVWNQPIWGFTSKIGPVKPLASLPSSERLFRAPGTSHIVDVETAVVYGTGAQPSFAYPDEQRGGIDWDVFRQSRAGFGVMDLKYSLELDPNGLVIGGEWSPEIERHRNVPDFFWRLHGTLTDFKRDGSPSLIRYTLVKQLNDCSQREPDSKKTVEIAGQPRDLHFVTCNLTD